MKNNNWEYIWNQRVSKTFENPDGTIPALMKYNGFDSITGTVDKEDWINMVKSFCKKININEETKILEIGCGAGAYLYVMKKIKKFIPFGIDYSKSLIEIAKKHIPDGQFYVSEANKFPKFDCSFEIIFSHSVFHYFPNYEYVNIVLKQCYENLTPYGEIYIMDICDKEKEKEYHNERSSSFKTPEEYYSMYENLPHLFIGKNKLRLTLEMIGFNDIKFFPHFIENYSNSNFRYNVSAKK